MDVTPRGLLYSWAPQLPALLYTALLASIGKSPNAEHQEWITEVLVRCVKPVLGTPTALLKSQQFFNKDLLGVWGRMWVAKYSVPPPQIEAASIRDYEGVFTIEQAVAFTIDELATNADEKACSIPPFQASGVGTEWTAYRPGARRVSRQPAKLSPNDVYDYAVRDLPDGEDSAVIIYAHGGAFCLMDPANHRHPASRLAQLTDSRVLNVRYRLSPQNIFPAALMDLFLVYLALLAPPPGAFHKAVPASRIVLAGDSSGGNLVTALQILLATLVRTGHNKIRNPWSESSTELQDNITIPDLPCAALSVISPWLDITRSLPSSHLNARYDFIAPAPQLHESLVSTSPLFPADSIWPSNPLRTETYCDAKMCAHPLVSPIMARKEILQHVKGAFYASCGWEGMSDETEVFARRMWESRTDAHEQAVKQPFTSDHGHPRQQNGGNSGPTSSTTTNEMQDLRRATSDVDIQVGSTKQRSLPASNPVETASSEMEFQEQSLDNSYYSIVFDGYIGQPHTFSVFPFTRAGWKANQMRAEHIRQSVMRSSHANSASKHSRTITQKHQVGSARWTNSKNLKETQISFLELGMFLGRSPFCGYDRAEALTDGVVHRLVSDGRNFRVHLEARLRREAEAKSKLERKEAISKLATGASNVVTSIIRAIFQDFVLMFEIVRSLVWSVIFLGRDWAFTFFDSMLWIAMQLGIDL